MSGLEFILPALALAGTATTTVLGMGAAAQEQQARENQQRAAEQQAKLDYERKIARSDARSAFRTAQLARGAGGMAKLLGGLGDMNVGGGGSSLSPNTSEFWLQNQRVKYGSGSNYS